MAYLKTAFSQNGTLVGSSEKITASARIAVAFDVPSQAVTLDLATSGVSAGTYTQVTVDTYGRVVAASAIGSAQITSALGYTPANRAGDTFTGAVLGVSGSFSGALVAATGSYSGTVQAAGFTGPLTGTASAASTLAAAQPIALSGDASGTANFAGNTGATIAVTLASVATAGTYSRVVVNAKGLVTGGQAWTRTVVDAATYTLAASDFYLAVTYPTTGPCTITLSGGIEGRTLIVKDESGNAWTNNVTLSSTDQIDNTTTQLLNVNFESVHLIYSGSKWWIV